MKLAQIRFPPFLAVICVMCMTLYVVKVKQANWKMGLKTREESSFLPLNYNPRFKARRRRLQKSCRGNNETMLWNNHVQFIADPSHKVVACVVQKAGSENWQQTIWEGRETEPYGGGPTRTVNFQHARNLSNSIKHELMVDNDVIRAMTVRHPFARLVSGWGQKFCKGYNIKHEGRFMSMEDYNVYSKRYPPEEDGCISFRGFVDYLLEADPTVINNHFKPIEKLCSPCSFPFDYIVKAETAPQDSDFVTEKFGKKLKPFVSNSAQGQVDSHSTELNDPMMIWKLNQQKVACIFKELPRETVQQLMQMFKVDFQRFGYTFDMETNIPGFVE